MNKTILILSLSITATEIAMLQTLFSQIGLNEFTVIKPVYTEHELKKIIAQQSNNKYQWIIVEVKDFYADYIQPMQ